VIAHPGDWLVVKSRSDSTSARRALIVATRNDDGSPPFTVRWTDDDHEALVFPGPDAEVVSAARQTELNRLEAERLDELQAQIATESTHSGNPEGR
jgi:hypothetical protein